MSHTLGKLFLPYREQELGLISRAYWFVNTLSHQAVIVFFAISGFVIADSVLRRLASGAWSWTEYLTQRATRLYVVLLPSLLLCWLFDYATLHNTGSLPVGAEHYRPLTLIGNLLFLQWVWVPTFGSNNPLWSLSYEFWFYLLFPAGVLACLPRQRLLMRMSCGTIALACTWLIGFEGGLFLLAWLCGAGANVILRIEPPAGMPTFFSGLSRWILPGLLGGAICFSRFDRARNGLTIEASWHDVFVSFAFALLMLNAAKQDRRRIEGPGAAVLQRAARILAWTASFSFTLYLAHLPLLFLIASVIHRGEQKWHLSGATLLAKAGIEMAMIGFGWILAQVTEVRTEQVRARVSRRSKAARSSPSAPRTAAVPADTGSLASKGNEL
jgi:peptidoglycan/LPS O-acetylase OafA/YrhL